MVALHRFRAPVGHKKGGCWLQVGGGCSSQVQINVNSLVVLQGGCSLKVVAVHRWLLKQVGLCVVFTLCRYYCHPWCQAGQLGGVSAKQAGWFSITLSLFYLINHNGSMLSPD